MKHSTLIAAAAGALGAFILLSLAAAFPTPGMTTWVGNFYGDAGSTLGLTNVNGSPWPVDNSANNKKLTLLAELDMTNATVIHQIVLTGTNTTITLVVTHDVGGFSTNIIPLGTSLYIPEYDGIARDPSGASIFIDGRDSGRLTPSALTVEKGSHSVLVRKPGFLDETMTADVQPGQTIGFAPRLRQLGSTDEIRSVNKMKKLFGGKDGVAGMGSVAIHTTPKGAQISVNQRVLDHLSPAEFLLNPGNYVVDVTASGYKPLHRVITVEKNGKLSIDEVLERE